MTETPSATGASTLPANVTDRTVSRAEGPAFGVTRTFRKSYDWKSTRASAATTMSWTSRRYPGSKGAPRSMPYARNGLGMRSQPGTGVSAR